MSAHNSQAGRLPFVEDERVREMPAARAGEQRIADVHDFLVEGGGSESKINAA